MFPLSSRYVTLIPYQVYDRRSRLVSIVPVPPVPSEQVLGYHILRQGQRIDHLAYKYLNEPTSFWRIGGLNDVMQVEQLTEADEIAIPTRGR